MSRFECLNDSNNWETKTSKNNNNKNKKKYVVNKQNNKNNSKKTNRKIEEVNFLDETLFPSLVDKKENEEKNNISNNYLNIVNQKIVTEKREETIAEGWTIIYKTNNNILIKKGNSNYKNNYTRKMYEEIDNNRKNMIANMIINNRYSERLELNSILGDISPYCNMIQQYEYDTREDEEIEAHEYSDSEYENDEEYN